MIPSNKRRLFGLILLLLVVIWFSTRKVDDESLDLQVEKTGTAGGISIRKVEIAPPSPNPQSTLLIKITTDPPSFSLGTYQYRWRVNNREVGNDESLLPGQFRQGDTVSVEVSLVPEREGIALSPVSTASIKIGNNAPVIRSIRLLPIPLSAGQSVRAEVVSEDQDGDFVQLRYEWQINRKLVDANDLDTLSGEKVHSADEILVFVTPSDPYEKGKMAVSPLVTVLNRVPEIVSIPPRQGQGKYIYQILAKDADLDTLKYTLLKGPPGMTVHPATGLVDWVVAPVSASQSDVAFEVSDGKGGTVVQQFTLQTFSK